MPSISTAAVAGASTAAIVATSPVAPAAPRAAAGVLSGGSTRPSSASTVPVAPVPAAGPFSGKCFRFDTGLRAGETASIRGASDELLLSFRSFSSVAGVVAALVSGIVFVTGIVAGLYLVSQGALFRALAAIALTVVCTFAIAMLVPRVGVTLYDGTRPVLSIVQRSVFPSALFLVAIPNGLVLAEIQRGPLSRIGRNSWRVLHDGRPIAEAFEESLGRALQRKLLGKFNRRFEADVVIEAARAQAGRIVRRPAEGRKIDTLEINGDALDRRVSVALATLILGREP